MTNSVDREPAFALVVAELVVRRSQVQPFVGELERPCVAVDQLGEQPRQLIDSRPCQWVLAHDCKQLSLRLASKLSAP